MSAMAHIPADQWLRETAQPDFSDAKLRNTAQKFTQARQSQRISFAVRGLEAKDERVFKSFVRLVAHRTVHQWLPAEGAAEVCVSPSSVLQEGARHLLLVVPEGESAGLDCVEMPFHADSLEQRLNELGMRVVAGRNAPGTRLPLPRRMCLVRWPKSELLRAPQRMRLATAMSGKSMSVHELHTRTSVPIDACSAFAYELLAHGYLAEAPSEDRDAATEPAVLAPSARSGLLARIRDRLSRITAIRA